MVNDDVREWDFVSQQSAAFSCPEHNVSAENPLLSVTLLEPVKISNGTTSQIPYIFRTLDLGTDLLRYLSE